MLGHETKTVDRLIAQARAQTLNQGRYFTRHTGALLTGTPE
jgi:hypothetical protein